MKENWVEQEPFQKLKKMEFPCTEDLLYDNLSANNIYSMVIVTHFIDKRCVIKCIIQFVLQTTEPRLRGFK